MKEYIEQSVVEIERNCEEWNEKCMKSSNGKVSRDLFFPTVFNRLECKAMVVDYVLIQFLTAHGKFGEYLHRFKISDKSTCEGGLQNQIVGCTVTSFV